MIWECEQCGKRQTDGRVGWPPRLYKLLYCCRCKVRGHHDFIDDPQSIKKNVVTP